MTPEQLYDDAAARVNAHVPLAIATFVQAIVTGSTAAGGTVSEAQAVTLTEAYLRRHHEFVPGEAVLGVGGRGGIVGVPTGPVR